MAKDIGFILQNINSAGKNAENHLNKAIEVSKEIGDRGVLGPDYLDLGLLHKAIGEKDRARRCLSSAIQVFVECKAKTCLKKAREELKS